MKKALVVVAVMGACLWVVSSLGTAGQAPPPVILAPPQQPGGVVQPPAFPPPAQPGAAVQPQPQLPIFPPPAQPGAAVQPQPQQPIFPPPAQPGGAQPPPAFPPPALPGAAPQPQIPVLAVPPQPGAAVQPQGPGGQSGSATAVLLSIVMPGAGEWMNRGFQGSFPTGECFAGYLCPFFMWSSALDAAVGDSSERVRFDFWVQPRRER